METKKTIYPLGQFFTHHPLYLDSLFVPTQQLHLKLTHNLISKNMQESVIITCPSYEISLDVIKNTLQQKIPQAYISQNMVFEKGKKNKKLNVTLSQNASLMQLKKETGRKKQSILQLKVRDEAFSSGNPVNKIIKLTQNRQKYEICLINLTSKSDVFSVCFQWSQLVDVKDQLVGQINQWYQSQLKEQDLQFSRLEIQLSPTKQFISFRFKKRSTIQSNQQMCSQVFSQQSDPIYIGFDINTNAFKYRKPVKILAEQNTINMQIRNNFLKNPLNVFVSDMQRVLVIQFQNKTGMPLDYNQVKQYKIKYLFGILRIPNYDRKGLLVFDRLYLPDQQVSDFQFEYSSRKDIIFLTAIVASQKQLFMNIINKEIVLEQKEIEKLDLKNIQFTNKKYACLTAYLGQGVYNAENNKKWQYVCQIICDYIEKYFVQIQYFQQKVWRRFIKNIIEEIQFLPLYKHQVFRVVNYECSAQEGDQISFKNILVTTRTKQIAQKMKIDNNQKYTIFKILSKTGRFVQNISELKLKQVIFLPYTSFIITRKIISQNITEIQMQEKCSVEQYYKSNLLIWIDNKPSEGKKLFKSIQRLQMKYPIMLLQLFSNSQFLQAFQKQKNLFQDKNVRKIVITNMYRPQFCKNQDLNQIAGVQTLRLVKKMIKDPKTEVIFYIGNKILAQQKLSKNGFDQRNFTLEVESDNLIKTLINLCNWQDVPNLSQEITEQQKFDLLIHSNIKSASVKQQVSNQIPKENPWGDMFSSIAK